MEPTGAHPLQREVEHLRHVVDDVPVMLWTAGADGGRDFVNGAWLEFTGRPSEEQIGDGWLEMVHPDDRPRWQAAVTAAAAVAQPASLDYRLRDAAGEYRWVRENVRPRIGANGELAGFVGACVDITNAHAEIARRQHEAEQLSRIARLVAETLDLTVVSERIAESALSLLGVHSSAIRLLRPDGLLGAIALGGRAKEYAGHDLVPAGVGLVGRAVAEGRPWWTADIRTDPRLDMSEALRARNAAVGIVAGAAVPLRVTGTVIGVLSVGSPTPRTFTDDEIRLLQAFADQAALALDNARLYERVKNHAEELERRVRERTTELEAAQESLVRAERLAFFGQLAGRFGHELRNPLGVIKNSVYYLRMLAPADQKVAKHYAMIDRQVEAANRIVTALLDFARLKPPAVVSVDLNALVHDYLRRTPVGQDVSVALELAEQLPALSADPSQLALVIGNLVTNAIQAMPEGGTLTITTAAAPDGVSLTISDTGQGIAPADQAKIFEPLFTTRTVGMGLGLSVVKNIVAGHGAAITVESSPGHGSRFTVRFAAPGC